jgi:iron(III) transport system substrate-binding protein
MNTKIGRAIGGIAALALLGASSLALAEPLTPEVIAAAEKEGKVVWYTATTPETAEALAKAFQQRYPKIKLTLERNGAERMQSRISQEYQSNIFAVDVATSSEIGHALIWKKNGWLVKYQPEDVEKYWPKDMLDSDGMFAIRTINIVIISYNTNLVKEADAPKTWKDLLDPKWKGKMVKSHPAYSGTTLTSTYLLSKELGWDYFNELAKQSVMQVQSAGDPGIKVGVGERAIGVDGSEQSTLMEIEKGAPIKIVYPTDGVPVTETPTGIMAKAPNPNAARVLMSWLFSVEGQQVGVDVGNNRGLHPGIKTKPGVPPLSSMKYLVDKDLENFVKSTEDVKKNYQTRFVNNNK